MGDEAEQFTLPCPNLATEETYGDGGEDDVHDRHEDASEKLRQRSASSPASSRASGGARVRARVEEGDNDRGKCEYINVELASGEFI